MRADIFCMFACNTVGVKTLLGAMSLLGTRRETQHIRRLLAPGFNRYFVSCDHDKEEEKRGSVRSTGNAERQTATAGILIR